MSYRSPEANRIHPSMARIRQSPFPAPRKRSAEAIEFVADIAMIQKVFAIVATGIVEQSLQPGSIENILDQYWEAMGFTSMNLKPHGAAVVKAHLINFACESTKEFYETLPRLRDDWLPTGFTPDNLIDKCGVKFNNQLAKGVENGTPHWLAIKAFVGQGLNTLQTLCGRIRADKQEERIDKLEREFEEVKDLLSIADKKKGPTAMDVAQDAEAETAASASSEASPATPSMIQSSTAGWVRQATKTNQDSIVTSPTCAVLCDGNGECGHLVSRYVATKLCAALSGSPLVSLDEMNQLLKEVDAALLAEAGERANHSGTTVSIILLDQESIGVYWIGDSQILYQTEAGAYHKTGKHSLQCETERALVQAQGGRLIGDGSRLLGDGFNTNLSRSMGNFSFKGIGKTASMAKLTRKGTKRIWVASDGIWDGQTDYEVVTKSAQAVTEDAVANGKKEGYADDASIVVITLT